MVAPSMYWGSGSLLHDLLCVVLVLMEQNSLWRPTRHFYVPGSKKDEGTKKDAPRPSRRLHEVSHHSPTYRSLAKLNHTYSLHLILCQGPYPIEAELLQ